MGKYNKTRVKRIITMIEEDYLSIAEICIKAGISRKIFYEWKATKPEFKEAVEEAYTVRDEKLFHRSRKSIMSREGGYKQIETKTTYVKSEDVGSEMIVKQYVVKERFWVPESSFTSSPDKIQVGNGDTYET